MKWVRLFRYAVVSSLFFLGFALIYNPFGICEFYTGVGRVSHWFHIVMLSSIILLTLILSRLLELFAVRNKNWKNSAMWTVGESLAIAFFTGLYTCLFCRMPYFPAVALTIKFTWSVLFYPALIIPLLERLSDLEAEKKAPVQPVEEKKDELVRFYDEHKRLKLVIEPSSILYVRAEDNYIRLFYQESGEVREYELRNSMKAIEPVTSQAKMVRCHRSYYVNPRYVRVLKKNRDGIYVAELDGNTVEAVPVSKKYYQDLSSIL